MANAGEMLTTKTTALLVSSFWVWWFFLVYCAVESRNNLEIFEGEDDEERDKRRVVFDPMLTWFLFGKR